MNLWFIRRLCPPMGIAAFAVILFFAAGLSAAPDGGTASDIDEPAAPLTQLKQRSEAQQDHLDALAHFAAGRMALQREDNSEALRQYARAHRYDPQAAQVLREIVPLAFSLDRPGVAVRYALLAVEKEPTDPLLMRRLAAFMTDEGDTDKSLLLYEKAAERAAAQNEKPNASVVLTWMEMGRLYYLARKFDKAAESFARVMNALEKPTEFGIDESMRKAIVGNGNVTYQLFGESFLDSGRLDDAVAAFEKSHKLKADEGQLAFNLARIDAKRGDPQAALAKLDAFFAVKRADEGTAPYLLLGEVLAALGKTDEFVPRLEKLRAADAENVPLRYVLAEQIRKSGKLDEAEALFQELLKVAKGRPPLEAYQGLISLDQERHAVEPLLTVLGDAVGRAGSLQSLGDVGKKLVADKELVNQIIAAAAKQHEANANEPSFGPRLVVAQLALANKQFDMADKWFNLAMETKPNKPAEFVLSWGLDLFLADRYAAAAKVFRSAINDKLISADNPAFHYYLAGALEMEGKTDEAVAVAREGAAIQPDAARFASRPAWILYHAKRHDDAKTEYEKLLTRFDAKHDSNETRDVMRDTRLVLSNIAVQRGKMPEAEEWLEQVLDEFPADVGALNDLGYLWADQNKHLERAVQMTQQAVTAEPKNAAYRDSLGWAYYRLGKFAEAAAEIQQSVVLEDNPDGVLLDHLGDALSKSGDATGAKDAWVKAVAAFEKQGDAEKATRTKEKLPK